ncbi:hypothetical protein P8452_59626 [Trifolium repens]|nr:hypothetical protein P8452_59626 [Trifolium repens]
MKNGGGVQYLRRVRVAVIDNDFPPSIRISSSQNQRVHNVHSLRLEIDKVYYRNDSIPTFHNLTQLEFVCSSLHYNWKFLVEVLNHCPKLQKLDLNETYLGKEPWIRKDDKQNWVDPNFVPQCLTLHLRTCNLFNFVGLQGDLLLASYNLSTLQKNREKNDDDVLQISLWKLISFSILTHKKGRMILDMVDICT